RVTRPTSEEAEAVIEPADDLCGGEMANTRRGELDGERYSVETLADLRHRGGRVRGGFEADIGSGSPFHEQSDCLRRRGRWDPEHMFALEFQGFATRCQHHGGPQTPEDRGAHIARSGKEVLAVVEDHERRRIAQTAEHRLSRGHASTRIACRGDR